MSSGDTQDAKDYELLEDESFEGVEEGGAGDMRTIALDRGDLSPGKEKSPAKSMAPAPPPLEPAPTLKDESAPKKIKIKVESEVRPSVGKKSDLEGKIKISAPRPQQKR